MSDYFLSGNRLLVLGASIPVPAELTPWDPVDLALSTPMSGSGVDPVDALLLAAWNDGSYLEGLDGLRSMVHPDGILALIVPCLRGTRLDHSLPYQIRPATLDRALRDAGFRLVEWTRLPHAQARSYRRWLASPMRRVVGAERSDIALALARPTGSGHASAKLTKLACPVD